MASYFDKTNTDIRRRDINLQKAEIEKVLPEHFLEQYPTLVSLFESYYEFLDQPDAPGRRIQEMYKNRDVTQVDADLLQYIEDELLLGQAYFGGFINKREASKFSNILYRSKGTRYSIQQFFRAFFGVDPEVVYPKQNIFRVGPTIDESLETSNYNGDQVVEPASNIGAQSQRYLTDDKLYQVLAVLIRTEIPINIWREVYKLFVHPSGMFLGGQVVIVSENETKIDTLMPEIIRPISTAVVVTAEAPNDITDQPEASVTGLLDSDATTLRIDLLPFDSDMTIAEINSYTSILTAQSPSLPVMDDTDSDGHGVTMDTERRQQTMDQDWYDSNGTY